MAIPKTIWRWAFYDFANSAYLLVYAVMLLPVFFEMIFKNTGHSLGSWGIANAVATLLGMIMAILIGKYSDKHSKFAAFKWSIFVSFLGMILIAIGVRYFVDILLYVYVFTQAFFILSLSLSDSILPHVAKESETYEYGGFAWGFGYLGGVSALIIAILLQKFLGDEYHPFVFVSTAIFYIIFSIYSLRGLRDVKFHEEIVEKPTLFLSKWQKFFLLLGYWFISEGISVMMLFISVYLKTEAKLSTTAVGIFFLAVQLFAFPATLYGGKLARKFDNVKLLGVTILCFGLAVLFLVLNLGTLGLIFVVIFGALATGNSQSYLRAQYATTIKRTESGYQFGVYTIVAEASVFIGPIAYGFASDYFNSQKIPLLILFGTMVVGYMMIWKVVKRLRV